ncbi:hypothetical protein POPTR_016G027600v4 [Populus trichocarpa]|uniref:Uncharacterized protein n=1 Tax=Populus trichocarpa TaxID=3694 RepID=A0ACC0RSL0_POPTR|nr:50S ribosomal protein 5 alpha, chloroplastic [Populus trichocarpa]KAI9380059.1 hypothetical protein POPTR_016G027600v4 [Populus trichocarpa]
MPLLLSNPLTSLSSLPPFSSPTLAFIATPVSRLDVKAFELKFKTWNGVRFQNPIRGNRIGAVIVRASSDIDGTAPTETSEPPVESKEEVVAVDKLPLESKLQEREEQKMKMKLARKIRLRRNRLVRKRRMRKKGRWPPSKMKKLKNV